MSNVPIIPIKINYKKYDNILKKDQNLKWKNCRRDTN